MRRIRRVHLIASQNFYDLLEAHKNKIQKRIGLQKKIPFPIFTEMLARSKMQLPLPKFDVIGLKNVKRKKSRLY
jgi:hypothetical protein